MKLISLGFLIAILAFTGCSPYIWQGFAEGYNAANGAKPSVKPSSSSSKEHVCPYCEMAMYFTGETKIEWGKLFYLYECPVGHRWWFPADEAKTNTNTYVTNPCPICGMETTFTGETYIEWGKLYCIYECPVGHRSVKPCGE